MALNPPYFLFVFDFLLVFVFFVVAFLSLFFLIDKKTVSRPKRAFFVYFQCLPLFLFSIFGVSPLSSLSLSLYVSCYFLSSFLPVFHFSFWFLLFLFVVFVFLFQDVLVFLFFCLLSCVVLNHNSSFLFVLHLVFLLLFFVFVVFIFC